MSDFNLHKTLQCHGTLFPAKSINSQHSNINLQQFSEFNDHMCCGIEF
jgi:hypothetical protein